MQETLDWVSERIKAVARAEKDGTFFLYLGRNIGLPVCLEGALKMKEISYIPSDAYAAGEMKHGPIALLDESTPVVCVATDSPILDKVLSNVEEVRARGADVISIATEGTPRVAEASDLAIEVPAPTGSSSRSSRSFRSSCWRTTWPVCAASTSTSRGTSRRPSRSSSFPARPLSHPARARARRAATTRGQRCKRHGFIRRLAPWCSRRRGRPTGWSRTLKA